MSTQRATVPAGKPTVVDYSWGRPDPGCLRGSGYVGVCRYLSRDRSGKTLSPTERTRLHDAGLWIVLNWEGTGNWSEFSGGVTAGTSAGRHAAELCRTLAAPASVPIFVSADYGAPRHHWPTIVEWLRAFADASGRRVGFYGQGDLGDHLLDVGAAEWLWQTNAHGWGGVSDRAVLYQKLPGRVCGADVDPNVLAGNPNDWAWMPHQTVNLEEDDMTPDQIKQAADTNDQAHKAALQSAGALAEARKAALLAASAEAQTKEIAEAVARIEKLLSARASKA